MPIPKPHLPRRRGRWVAALALVLVVVAVLIVVESNSANPNHSPGAGTTATGAVTVQRRNLVATDTQSGTLSYAEQQTVYNRLSGTITWVPQIGQVIRAGHALFTVDNKPVLLMNGSTPAYRNLTAADISGPDVYELNRNLVDLGYNPDGIVIDDTWQAATTAGVEDLQYHLGDTQNGTLTLGQIVFLPGPQMVQTIDTTVGSTVASYAPSSHGAEFVDYASDAGTTGTTGTGTTGTTGTGTTGTATTGTGTTGTGTTTLPGTGTTTPPTTTGPTTTPVREGPSHSPPTNSHRTASSGGDNLSRQTLRQLLRLIQEQQRQLQAERRAAHSPSSGRPTTGNHSPSGSNPPTSKSPPSNHNSGNGNSGNPVPSGNSPTSSGGGSATAVLSTSSTRLVVTVDLGASSQSEATIGEHVTVQMPNGSMAAGHITAVSPVAQSSSSGSGANSGGGTGGGGSGASTVPVTIVLNRPAKGGGLDQASVSVSFVQSKARHVLSVPVTALLATSGSTFAVQQASAAHRLIPVHTGLFAAGYVAISGRGIHPGLRVTDSQG